jgi:hypothetical protein
MGIVKVLMWIGILSVQRPRGWCGLALGMRALNSVKLKIV